MLFKSLYFAGVFGTKPIGAEFTLFPHESALFVKTGENSAKLVSGRSFQFKRKGQKMPISAKTKILQWREE